MYVYTHTYAPTFNKCTNLLVWSFTITYTIYVEHDSLIILNNFQQIKTGKQTSLSLSFFHNKQKENKKFRLFSLKINYKHHLKKYS